jgi:hypothetical protein
MGFNAACLRATGPEPTQLKFCVNRADTRADARPTEWYDRSGAAREAWGQLIRCTRAKANHSPQARESRPSIPPRQPRAARPFRVRFVLGRDGRAGAAERRDDGKRNFRTVQDRHSTSSRKALFVSPSQPVTSRWHVVQIDASAITAMVIVEAHESQFARCMTAPLPVAIHPTFFKARASACSFPHAHRIDSTLGPHVRLRHVIRFPKGRRLP